MKNTALITGASSGIGKELATIHAEKGGNLILVARGQDKLNELKAELEKKHGIQVNEDKFSALTSREKQILSYIVEGYSNQKLSLEVGVSVNTARTHRNRIWKKLEISSLHEAIKYTVFFK